MIKKRTKKPLRIFKSETNELYLEVIKRGEIKYLKINPKFRAYNYLSGNK